MPGLAELTRLILEYRYWILLPLSFVEGPVTAFLAGTLASAGYFNIFALAAFFFVRDVAVDLGCYALGYRGGQTAWARRLLARLGVAEAQLDDVRLLWTSRPGLTMVLGKLSYGVAAGFIVVAGLVRMPLPTFLAYGSAVAVVHYGALLAVGYFFGATFGGALENIVQRIPEALLGLSVLAVAYYLFRRRVGRTLRDEGRKARA